MKPLQRYDIDYGRAYPHSDGDWVRDADVKKLEKQNEMMLGALEKFTKIEYAMGKDLMIYGNTYVPEEWLQFLTLANDIITKVKGERE
jgi:hypothetical protein